MWLMTGPFKVHPELNETACGDDRDRQVTIDVHPRPIYSVYCLPTKGILYSHRCSVTLRHL